MTAIKKAVFPVAGLGSRFLPATKAQPKEMLPIVDKPLIQYAVEEAVAAGITEMVFITGRNKRAIEDHFDKAYELEAELEAAGKEALLKLVRQVIPKHISCIYIRQSEPLGLGHAVLCARPVIGNDPFAVLLADDFMDTAAGYKPVLAQMTDLYGYEKCSVLAVPEDAPSTLAVVGRYVLSGAIFDHLATIGTGAGGEIQLTDGIAALMAHERVLAYRYAGQRYDCGSKLGYLKAMTAVGLKHPETAAGFAEFLAALDKEKRQ